MNVVITMAGLGTRFKNAGYKLPKYMIEVNGKTLFEWSLLSFQEFIDNVDDLYFYFIVRNDDNAINFIDELCGKLKINNYKTIGIDNLTDGQATTALLARPFWNEQDELIIYNIDTYIEEYQLKHREIKGDGCIPCFKSSGDHWSFVKTNESGKVIEIKEKVRISDNCSIGLYYFKTCKLYERLYNEYYNEQYNIQQTKQEKYIAPIYNKLLEENGEINIVNLDSEKVHVLGTPEEVEKFKTLSLKK